MYRKVLSLIVLLCFCYDLGDGKVGTFHRPRTGEPMQWDNADLKVELDRSPQPQMPCAGSTAYSFIEVPLAESITVSPNRYSFFCHSSGGLPLNNPN